MHSIRDLSFLSFYKRRFFSLTHDSLMILSDIILVSPPIAGDIINLSVSQHKFDILYTPLCLISLTFFPALLLYMVYSPVKFNITVRLPLNLPIGLNLTYCYIPQIIVLTFLLHALSTDAFISVLLGLFSTSNASLPNFPL